jgi:hypothetical protein
MMMMMMMMMMRGLGIFLLLAIKGVHNVLEDR